METYVVTGMTCEHCRRAVLEEVEAVAGVERVEVDLTTGRMSVAGGGVDPGEVAGAVAEAGYALEPAEGEER